MDWSTLLEASAFVVVAILWYRSNARWQELLTNHLSDDVKARQETTAALRENTSVLHEIKGRLSP